MQNTVLKIYIVSRSVQGYEHSVQRPPDKSSRADSDIEDGNRNGGDFLATPHSLELELGLDSLFPPEKKRGSEIKKGI